jgi:hypothetical protein
LLPRDALYCVLGYASFTVDGQGGRVGPSAQDWAAGVLHTLPRLERLTLVVTAGVLHTLPLLERLTLVTLVYDAYLILDRPLFVCRHRDDERQESCGALAGGSGSRVPGRGLC